MKHYTYIEFVRLIEQNGFHLKRKHGSHKIYYNNEGRHITIYNKIYPCIMRRLIKENNLIEHKKI